VTVLLYGAFLVIVVIVGLLVVFGFATASFFRSWRLALHVGIPKDKLKKMIKSTVLFTIIPSLVIVIVLFSLSRLLGVPLSWFRLSVVGSLAYELLAAEMTVSGFGYDSLSQFITTDDISSAISIMFVMGISIIGGIVFMIFFGKRLQTGLLNYQEKNS